MTQTDKTTQQKKILEHLRAGKKLNRIIALKELFLFELSARICELRNKGFNIISERTDKRIVDYKLIEN